MFHQMAQLGKNKFGTGQFASIEAARHAENNGVADNAAIMSRATAGVIGNTVVFCKH